MMGKEIALGPGKMQLLALLKETGSILKSAKRMDMSYMRAWTLIRTMNRCFRNPLVDAERGGSRGGGARLTALGEKVLKLYQTMQNESLAATRQTRARLLRLLSATHRKKQRPASRRIRAKTH